MITTPPATPRTRRDERGSVLVFVVGVLVLLALAATAYLSTARVDRVTTKQNEFTTQIDLLLDACRELAMSAILNDKTVSFNATDFYDLNAGATSIWSTNYLAARVPTNFDPTQPWNGNNPGGWTGITAALIGSSFEAPTGQIVTYDASIRPMLMPTGIQYGGRLQPVFGYDNNAGNPGFQAPPNTDLAVSGGGNLIFAGDADGDGIADALPVKLPVGKINGIEYFAYFRIIDNGSAVNASTASSRWFDFDSSGTRLNFDIHGFYLTNVGLLEMLATYTVGGNFAAMGAEFNELNAWKLNTGGTAPTIADVGAPRQDDNFVRADMNWASVGDAFHHQLAMRVDNPGRVRSGIDYQAFQVSDSSALASRFILRDSLGSMSTLETVLQESVYDNVPSAPYTADQAQTAGGWYDTFFEPTDVDRSLFDLTFFRPRRALITADSRFRQMAPTIYAATPDATWPNAAMRWDAPATAGISNTGKAAVPKVSINNADFGELFRGFWQVFAEPTASAADNSGTIFDETAINNFYNGTGLGPYTPYRGMNFSSLDQNAANSAGAVPATEADRHPARMFRSPVRSTSDAAVDPPTVHTYSTTAVIPADQVMVLRAALAATNLLSSRLSNSPQEASPPNDTDVVSAPDIIVENQITVRGKVAGTDTALTVKMFGIKRQPYISEVFAQNDTAANGPLPNGVGGGKNERGYVAIELYNPHDIPIDITNCRIGLLRRHGNTDRGLALDPSLPYFALRDTTLEADMIDFNESGAFVSNSDTEYEDRAGNRRLIVPAKGYLVLENYSAGGLDAGIAARYRPGSVLPATPPVDPTTTPTSGVQTLGTVAVTSRLTTPADPNRVPDFDIVYVRNLHQVFNREFVLMRPKGAVIVERTVMRRGIAADIPCLTYTYGNSDATPNKAARDQISLRDNFVPLDSYDFTGLCIDRSTDPEDLEWTNFGRASATAWHYQRKVDTNTGLPFDQPLWQHVYPGRYEGSKSETNAAEAMPRQQGTAVATPWNPGSQLDTWDPARGSAAQPSVTPRDDDEKPTLTLANPTPLQDKVFTIPLAMRDWPGINYLRGAANVFPFGKFARAGDLMQVPFIGSYMIYDATLARNTDTDLNNDVFVEINPITMDAAMAEDTDPENDGPATSDVHSTEQIGRFAPLGPTLTGGTPTVYTDPAAAYNDYQSVDPTKHRYRFGRRLFDFFSVYTPSNDYMPNISSNAYGYWTWNASIPTPIAVMGAPLPTPVPIDNAGRGTAATTNRIDANPANDAFENTLPVHGLININTASAEVLALLPWIPNGLSPNNARLLTWDTTTNPIPSLRPWNTGDADVDDNHDIARAIVFWRDGNRASNPTVNPVGPFLSPFDLYKVPGFRTAQAQLNFGDSNGDGTANDEPDDRTGELSPYDPTRNNTTSDPTGDGIRRDFEEQFLLLNRVSNLITTRSDTFTVYILLQGWRNAGSAAAELVVERRAAMIVDRSSYTPSNGNVSTTRVPTN